MSLFCQFTLLNIYRTNDVETLFINLLEYSNNCSIFLFYPKLTKMHCHSAFLLFFCTMTVQILSPCCKIKEMAGKAGVSNEYLQRFLGISNGTFYTYQRRY